MVSLYLRVRGRVMGPFGVDRLQEMRIRGQLQAFHEVSTDGSVWRPAGSHPELFPHDGIVQPQTQTYAPAPPAATPAPPQPVNAFVSNDGTQGYAPVFTRGPNSQRVSIWSVPMLAGAIILVIAFAVPWWQMTYTPGASFGPSLAPAQREIRQRAEEQAMETFKQEMDIYFSYSKTIRMKIDIVLKGKSPETLLVWGWSSAGAIVGLLLAILMIPTIFISFFAPAIRVWTWIGSFIWMMAGIAILIVSLIWVFDSPNIGITQCVANFSAGPFVAVAAVAMIIPSSLVHAIQGLRATIVNAKLG